MLKKLKRVIFFFFHGLLFLSTKTKPPMSCVAWEANIWGLIVVFNAQFAKELWTVEIGGWCTYGIPTDEMGDGKFVSALVEIAFKRQTIQSLDVVAKESGVGDA